MIKPTLLGRAKGWVFFLWMYLCALGMFPFVFLCWIPTLFSSLREIGELGIDTLVGWWIAMASSLIDYMYDVDFRVYGDKLQTCSAGKKQILVANHRTRIDFFFIMHLLHKVSYPSAHLKILLKKVFLMYPVVGAIMEFARFMFVSRDAEKDVPYLRKMYRRLKESSRPAILLLQPEAYTLTSRTVEEMEDYASSKGIPPFRRVLFPRPSGLLTALETLGDDVTELYDVTLGYHDLLDTTEPFTEVDFTIGGRQLKRLSVNIVQYNTSYIPKDREGLQKCLRKVWEHKDSSLAELSGTGIYARKEQKLREKSLIPIIRFQLLNAVTLWALYHSSNFLILYILSASLPVALALFGHPSAMAQWIVF